MGEIILVGEKEITKKTSLKLNAALWKEFQKRCIDLDIESNSHGVDLAIELWLESSKQKTEPSRKRSAS